MDTSKIQKGIIGQFYDSSLRNTVSLIAEENIPFGIPLMRGTNPETQVKQFNGTINTEMVGVAGFSALQANGPFSATRPQGYYLKGTPVTVVKEGRMYVPLYGPQTVEVGATAYIDALADRITSIYVANQTAPIGKFLTGGTTPIDNVAMTFVIDLIEGYREPIPADLKSADTLDSKPESKELNFKKSKEKK